MIKPEKRRSLLRESIDAQGFVRLIDAHSGISALVGESARSEHANEVHEFDGFWESSLTDSASKGHPDAQVVSVDSRLHTIREILEVTNKPVIVDGDNGRSPMEFEHLVRRLDALGVSGVVIEDKQFPKRNSLDRSARQTLEDPNLFSQKISRGKQAALNDDFMVIARVESLIAGTGMDDALERSASYLHAGAHGIMIHSHRDDPKEILAFAKEYGKLRRQLSKPPILVCVPTTYNLISDRDLAGHGFNIIIHANHLLRSSYKAMKEAAQAILMNDRSFEAEPHCAPISEVFQVVGYDRIVEQDRRYSKDERLSIIIPAAGKDPAFPEIPKSLIDIGGKPILTHQLESLHQAGLTNNKVVVVRGHHAQQFPHGDIEYRENPRYLETNSLYSLFQAEDAMEDGFLLVYSDILFAPELIQRLLQSRKDIVLLIDNSYRYHKHEADKKLDLVVSGRRSISHHRRLQPNALIDVISIGKEIPKESADHEFVGIAYFSKEGAEILRKVYRDSDEQAMGTFHEGQSFQQAQVTDLFQEIIDRGFRVHGLEISMGWIEVHNQQDIRIAEEELLPAKARAE